MRKRLSVVGYERSRGQLETALFRARAANIDQVRTTNVKKLLAAYTNAPGQNLETAKDTAWGLVNAVTYFADHERRARNPGSRLDSAWFGLSARLKTKAFNKAIELAEAA